VHSLSSDGPAVAAGPPVGAAAGLVIERLPITAPDAVLLVEQVQEEYVARYGGRDESPIDASEFEDPTGMFFVGRLGSVPVVSGAWRRRTDVLVDGTRLTAEVKRMYVAPTARGLGLARRMLAHLEVTAHAAGLEAVVLETGEKQPEAIELYSSAGYRRIAGFGYYRDSPLSRCFGKSLRDVPGLSSRHAGQ
jgi:ribosomal protein S18 acetylase RimI-like enzyme